MLFESPGLNVVYDQLAPCLGSNFCFKPFHMPSTIVPYRTTRERVSDLFHARVNVKKIIAIIKCSKRTIFSGDSRSRNAPVFFLTLLPFLNGWTDLPDIWQPQPPHHSKKLSLKSLWPPWPPRPFRGRFLSHWCDCPEMCNACPK